MTTDAERAVRELGDAIVATRASDEWWIEDHVIFEFAQACVVRWAEDLGRSLGRIGAALGRAREHSGAPDEEVAAVLEEALTQIGSARDKIVATAAQILGVSSIVLQKPGVKFEPRDSAVKGRYRFSVRTSRRPEG